MGKETVNESQMSIAKMFSFTKKKIFKTASSFFLRSSYKIQHEIFCLGAHMKPAKENESQHLHLPSLKEYLS